MSETAPSSRGSSDTKRAVLLGLKVIAGLAVLTVLEFLAAETLRPATVPVFALSIVKGWLILDCFMHFRAVLGGHTDSALDESQART